MNKNKLYSEFVKDLQQLYCKTKNTKIESSYIKMAALLGHSFIEWLNDKNSQKSISQKIKNEEVYNTLKFLAQILQSGGGKIDKPYVVRAVTNDTYIISVIISLSSILNDVRVSNILLPFRGVIDEINKIFHIETKNTAEDQKVIDAKNNNVLNGVLSIYKFYEESDIGEEISVEKKKKISLYDKRFGIMRYLLNRFSRDLSAAALSSGLKEISNKFDSGILAKNANSGIGRMIEINPLSSYQYHTVIKMVDSAWNSPDPKYYDYNHDNIQLNLLRSAESIGSEDFYKIYEKYEENKDPLLNISSDKIPGIDSLGKINNNVLLNPEYIHMLTVFFVEFQSRLNIPV